MTGLAVFIPLFVFAFGAAAARLARTSRIVAAGGSALAFLAAVVARSGFVVSWRPGTDPGLVVGLRFDHITAIFLSISALSWIAISLASMRSTDRNEPRAAVGLNLTMFGLYLVLTAADVVTFLVGWEIMTVFAFTMIVRHADETDDAFRFLAFGELSSLLLLIGFAVFFAHTRSLLLSEHPRLPGSVILLSTLGVIVKMDVAPFHTWMRKVYERLPGYVGALMSVAVTLAGVYGLRRLLGFGDASQWWLILITLLGALSAFWGALHSTVAGGVRTVPAYSTVEYSGMILCAAGISSMAGGGSGDGLRYLGEFAGAAVVVLTLSHAFAKSLFFVSLGDAVDQAGGVRIDEVRSVWKRAGKLPALGIATAGLSFAAFPPLAGFAGEWMLLETTFQSFRFPSFAERFAASLSGVFLALAMGMIAFSMAKYVGYVVLGNDDGEGPLNQNRSRSLLLRAVETGLILLVVAGGVAVPLVLILTGGSSMLGGLLGVPHPLLLISGIPTFGVISPTFFAVVIIVLSGIPAAIWVGRRARSRSVTPWSGGLPPVRSERFSASAFSQILAFIMRAFTRTTERRVGGSVSLETRDPMEGIWRAARRLGDRIGTGLSRLYMNGRISWYVAYILITFVVVLIFASGQAQLAPK